MARHYIPHLAKGLVNKSISGRVTQDYNTKATELENVWIAPDKSTQKRPGLQRLPSNISDLPGVLDIKHTKDRIIVLREVELGPLGNLAQYLSDNSLDSLDLSAEENRALFDTQLRESPLFDTLLNYKQALDDSGMRVDTIETSMVEVADSEDELTDAMPLSLTDEVFNAGFRVDAEIRRTSELVIDKLLLILSYDRSTGDRIDSECYAISRSKEQTSETLTRLSVVDNPDVDGRVGSLDFSTRPWFLDRQTNERRLDREVNLTTSGIAGLTDALLGKGKAGDSDYVRGLIVENETELVTLRPTETITIRNQPATLASFDTAYETILDVLTPQPNTPCLLYTSPSPRDS